MPKKYIIFAPSYIETSGGAIVLHKLCSILNGLGHESYLYPYFETYQSISLYHSNKKNRFSILLRYLKAKITEKFTCYKVNKEFNTPIYDSSKKIGKDFIVIYPELVACNPLNASNIVRWLLHQPGFHTSAICYGKNEIYFRFNSAILDFNFPGSVTSNNFLKIIHYPLEFYNMDNIANKRNGTAYSIRKGKNKKIEHSLKDSILIDGDTNVQALSHKEVSKIFKSVETFISYDTYSAYSIFAALCGCRSIVIPDKDISKEEWYPDKEDRYGIAYGFDDIDAAIATENLVMNRIIHEEKKSISSVKNFIKEVDSFFS